MLKRLFPAAALTLAMVSAPAGIQGQTATAVSLHLGLFDGVGLGMAVSHWNHGSIYAPSFQVGFGVSTGMVPGVHTGAYSVAAPTWTSYRYGHVAPAWNPSCWYGWDHWHFGWEPYDWDCWWYQRPHYSSWGRHSYQWDPYWRGWDRHWRPGVHVSLGLGWNYYRRPVYFDPWWGWTGYLARWRPLWAYSPGWWYYNDPWYVTPGYSRVAYVVPAQRVVRVGAPLRGYATEYKEPARGVAAATRQAQPRAGSAPALGPNVAPARGAVAQPAPGTARGAAGRPGAPAAGVAQPGAAVQRPGAARAGVAQPGAAVQRPGAARAGVASARRGGAEAGYGPRRCGPAEGSCGSPVGSAPGRDRRGTAGPASRRICRCPALRHRPRSDSHRIWGNNPQHTGAYDQKPGGGSQHPGAQQDAHGGSQHPGTQQDAHGGSQHTGAQQDAHGGPQHTGTQQDAHCGPQHTGAQQDAHGGSQHPGACGQDAHGGSQHPGACGQDAHGGSQHPGAYGQDAHGGSQHPGAYGQDAHGGSQHPGACDQKPGGGPVSESHSVGPRPEFPAPGFVRGLGLTAEGRLNRFPPGNKDSPPDHLGRKPTGRDRVTSGEGEAAQ
jgi:hypothetical protein